MKLRMIALLTFFLIISLYTKAQFYPDVLNYNINGAPVNGIKIKTNIPFISTTAMPTVLIQGYAFNIAEPINIIMNWYVYGTGIINTKAISGGGYAPTITLANENGKVSIYLDSKVFYQRIHISAFAQGLSQDIAANYTGWSAVDSLLIPEATAATVVPYQSRLSGSISLPGGSVITSTGSIGLGYASPTAKLDIAGGINLRSTITNASTRPAISTTKIAGEIRGVSPVGDASDDGFIRLSAGGGTNISAQSFIEMTGFSTVSDMYKTIRMGTGGVEVIRINGSGNVGIGTSNPGLYKLAVEGTIGARKVQVKQTSWADFVFDDNYQLPSLYEVDKFIKANKHLKGIPAANEVLENGLDIGENNKMLLQVSEELMLHNINLRKDLDNLRFEIVTQRMMDLQNEIFPNRKKTK